LCHNITISIITYFLTYNILATAIAIPNNEYKTESNGYNAEGAPSTIETYLPAINPTIT
jgi:hypothetical protein